MNISCILKTQTTRIIWLYKVSCFAQNKNLPFPPVQQCHIYLLTYLLITRRVPGYPLRYPVGYPGSKLPDNGSPTNNPCFMYVFIPKVVSFVCLKPNSLCGSTIAKKEINNRSLTSVQTFFPGSIVGVIILLRVETNVAEFDHKVF